MSDSEIKTTSYVGNLKNSIGGIIIGLILFVISIVLLWSNEGNLAAKNKLANYINSNAIAVESTQVDKNNDNKLISTSAAAVSNQSLSDDIITVPDILVLNRKVEMYQWEENEQTKTETQTGGSTKETTTYSYEKVWSEDEIDSSNFHNKAYSNPAFSIKSKRINAKNGTLGDFKLSEVQTSSFHNLAQYDKLPENSKYKIVENYYFKGIDMTAPRIGDIRISYQYMPSNSQISVIGAQRPDKTITPMELKQGKIYIQYDGILTQAEMVEKYKKANLLTTNIFRLFGFILMFIGLNLILKPISVLLSFIPIFSNVVSALTGGIVFLVSVVLTLVVIALAWLFYRPVLTICLLAVAAIIVLLITKRTIFKKQS